MKSDNLDDRIIKTHSLYENIVGAVYGTLPVLVGFGVDSAVGIDSAKWTAVGVVFGILGSAYYATKLYIQDDKTV